MGVHLKSILAERGDEVFITSRRPQKNSPQIHYFRGDAHDLFFLRPLLDKRWDAIVDFMVYSTKEFSLRVGLLLDSTDQYVFMSSARVYSNIESPITESSPRLLDSCKDEAFLSTDEYSLKKAREEDLLSKSGRMNYTIIRPYITYSENRLQLGDLEYQYWLPRALDGRSIVFSEDIKDHLTTLTYGHNVAEGIAALIGNKQAMGEVFNITSGCSLAWSNVLKIYLDAIEDYTGNRPNVKWIKQSLKLDRAKLKYQIIYDRLFDRVFDNSKLLSIAPTLSFIRPKEGLRSCIKAFVNSGEPLTFSGAREGILDRLSGERMRICRLQGTKERIKYILCRYFYFDKIFKKIQ